MNYCKYCLEPSGNSDVCPKCQGEKAKVVPPHRLLPGTLLCNRYLVGKVLGEGGFGITYVGRDTKLDMKVAVKEYYPNGLASRNNTFSSTVSCSASDDKQDVFMKFRDKFLQEARTLAMFSKEKSIVEVRDFFETNNTAYIIMEYLDGQDLREYQRANGNMPVEKAIQVLAPVMRTLGKIHQQGLIHRDISPDNIRLTPEGVKLLDFGAAREMNTQINRSISVMLKPGYAPEEQYRSKGVQGPWTDVYAVCATIYKCITGITPDDATQRVYSDELKKPSELGIKISPAVEAVLLKGMSVFQRERYKSMDELMTAFTNALQNRPNPSTTAKTQQTNIGKAASASAPKTPAQQKVATPPQQKTPPKQPNTPPQQSKTPSQQRPPIQNSQTKKSVYTPTPTATATNKPATPPVYTPPVDRSIPHKPSTYNPPATTSKTYVSPTPNKKNLTPFIIVGVALLLAAVICIVIVVYSKTGGFKKNVSDVKETTTTQAAASPNLADAENLATQLYDFLLDSDIRGLNQHEILDWTYLTDAVDTALLDEYGTNDLAEAYSELNYYEGIDVNNADEYIDYVFGEYLDYKTEVEDAYGSDFTINYSNITSKILSVEEGKSYVQSTKNEISDYYGEYIDPNGINANGITHYALVEYDFEISGSNDQYMGKMCTVLGFINGEWKYVYVSEIYDDGYNDIFPLFSIGMLSNLI